MNTRWKWAIGGGGMLLAGGLLWAVSGAAPDAGRPAPAVFRVTRGSFPITLEEEGSLKARDSIRIIPGFEGNLTITRLVPPGTMVQKGDVLAEFDRSAAEQRASQLELEVKGAESLVIQAREDIKIQELANQTDIARAELALKVAEQELKQFVELQRDKAVREAEVKIENAEVALRDAGLDLEELKLMFQEELVSEYEVHKAELALKTAQVALDSAKTEHTLLLAYTHPLTLLKLTAAVDEARNGLAKSTSTAESYLTQKKTALLKAEAALNEYRANLKKATEDLAKLRVTAPADGMLVHGDGEADDWRAEPEIKVGAPFWGTNILFTIPELGKMNVQFTVSETDIRRVKTDTPVEVRLHAFPDRVFRGKVVKIAALASRGRRWFASSDRNTFAVEAALDDDGADALRPGMKGRVRLLLGAVEDALYVPVEAVFEEEGKQFCWRRGFGGARKTEVKTGESNDSFVALREGLSEGDEVYLADPTRP
jgi:HlyD family secretion protein